MSKTRMPEVRWIAALRTIHLVGKVCSANTLAMLPAMGAVERVGRAVYVVVLPAMLAQNASNVNMDAGLPYGGESVLSVRRPIPSPEDALKDP